MENQKRKLEQFRLPQDLASELQVYSDASGMDKTEIVEKALRAQMKTEVESVLKNRLAAVLGIPPEKPADGQLKLNSSPNGAAHQVVQNFANEIRGQVPAKARSKQPHK